MFLYEYKLTFLRLRIPPCEYESKLTGTNRKVLKLRHRGHRSQGKQSISSSSSCSSPRGKHGGKYRRRQPPGIDIIYVDLDIMYIYTLCVYNVYVRRRLIDRRCLLELTNRPAAILDWSHMRLKCVYYTEKGV